MKSIIILLLSVFFAISQTALSTLYIDGDFNGWEGETIVKLSDGTFWIQSEYQYDYCYSYNPKVSIIKEDGKTLLFVNGCGKKGVAVQQITNVIESKINGEFKGFGDETLFKLTNGSTWKQKRYKYWYKYAYNPPCLVYNYNGWKLSIFGKTIDVEKVY